MLLMFDIRPVITDVIVNSRHSVPITSGLLVTVVGVPTVVTACALSSFAAVFPEHHDLVI